MKWTAISAALVVTAVCGRSEAGEPERTLPPCNDPKTITAAERPAREPSDTARGLADVVLFVPRQLVGLVFFATGAAAGLIENEQVVPRVRQMLFSRDGQIGVFPTVFLETGTSPNVGARMVASVDNTATTLRSGYGGADTNVVESRMRFGTAGPAPTMLSIEGLHDRRTQLGYLGLGQDPGSDPRNAFVSDLRQATYRERRERAIVSFGIRPGADIELFLSSSYAQRFTEDAPDLGPGFQDVFAPRSVPGAQRLTRLVYTELAVRLDTRQARAAPAAGVLMEGYGGTAHGVLDDPSGLLRLGGRAAAFVPLVRRTNILSPRIILDTVTGSSGREIPFQELAHQPEFRGFDTRRDHVSMVLSLDYRWKFASFIAARVFVDGATVAPTVQEIDFKQLRYAAGAGIDLFSSDVELARLGFAASRDGVSLLLSFGVSPRFGDRQHRD